MLLLTVLSDADHMWAVEIIVGERSVARSHPEDLPRFDATGESVCPACHNQS